MKLTFFLLGLFIVACSAVSKSHLRQTTNTVTIQIPCKNLNIYVYVSSPNTQKITFTDDAKNSRVWEGLGENKQIAFESFNYGVTGRTATFKFDYFSARQWSRSNAIWSKNWSNLPSIGKTTAIVADNYDDYDFNDVIITLKCYGF